MGNGIESFNKGSFASNAQVTSQHFMRNIYSFLQELASIRNLEEFNKHAPLLVTFIKNILLAIKDTPNLESANKHFDLLESVQIVLATLLFKKHIKLSQHLKTFVKDFDRIDDMETRKFLYEQAKKGSYKLFV